jgi:Trypsin-co-occurring domain 2
MSLRDATKYLSLSDAIDSLKDELLKADLRARRFGNDLFEVKECEIELSLEFEPKAEAEFNLGVFKVAAGAGATGGHKVTVHFAPTRKLLGIVGDEYGRDFELGEVRIDPTDRKSDPV